MKAVRLSHFGLQRGRALSPATIFTMASSTPALRFPLNSLVAPGDRLGTTRQDLLASDGTYMQSGHLHANTVGLVQVKKPVVKGKSKTLNYPVQVVHPQPNSPQIMHVGQVVLGRVMRLSIQQAFVDLLGEQQGGSPHASFSKVGEGIIRREDALPTASEQMKIQNMFRPGDVLLCRILSFGDRRYLLGTAEPSLGVIQAHSITSKVPMIPITWKEMQCPITGEKETRKCAKPPKQLLERLSR